MTDVELLARHQTHPDDASAFADLVRRHVGWVHGVARRRLRDAHLAEDVTQAVFVLLHRKRPRFDADRAVVAWLHRATWYASEVAARERSRRQMRETEAATMRPTGRADGTEPAEWAELAPILDELIERLSRGDREAVLLRYYRQMSYADVAAATGSTAEAARKRVERAIEKLRQMASARGLTVAVSAVVLLMEANAASAAPAGLAAATTTAALSATPGVLAGAMATTISNGAAIMITLNQAKVAALVLAGAGLFCLGGAALVSTRSTPMKVAVPVAAQSGAGVSRPSATAVRPDFPKLAPFSAVRWKAGDVAEVEIAGKWYALLAINDVEAPQLVAFARKTYGPLWQKRIEEDLVEVMTLGKKPPGDTVSVRGRNLETGKIEELKSVAMTPANRRKLWDARQARER